MLFDCVVCLTASSFGVDEHWASVRVFRASASYSASSEIFPYAWAERSSIGLVSVSIQGILDC